MAYYIGQFFGICGFILYIISMQQKNKPQILVFQIFAFLLYTIQYFVLELYSGMCVFLLNTVKSIVFYVNKKNNNQNLILIIFIVFTILLGTLTIKTYYDFIPIIANILSIIFTWQKGIGVLRYGQIITCILWIIYNLLSSIYMRSFYRSNNCNFNIFCNFKI